jgi:glycerol 3-phosphatase-1
MKLAHPKILVCAEDVLHGKPDPSCYNLAKERLSLPSDARILVVEDALAGIKSGKAAGCEVLGLTTTHSAKEVSATEADWVVRDPRSLKILGWDEERKIVRIEISDALIR